MLRRCIAPSKVPKVLEATYDSPYEGHFAIMLATHKAR